MRDQLSQLRRDLERLSADKRATVERFLAEMELAEGLCRLQSTRAGRWKKLIQRSRYPLLH